MVSITIKYTHVVKKIKMLNIKKQKVFISTTLGFVYASIFLNVHIVRLFDPLSTVRG